MLTIIPLAKGGIQLQTSAKTLLLFPEGNPKADEKTLVLLGESVEDEDQYVISWPGEYDYDGISIRVFGSPASKSVHYIVTIDEIRCGFFGSPLPEIAEEEEEAIGDLDVLAVPAEDAKKVQKLMEEIDPRIFLPIRTADAKAFTEVLAACGGKEAQEVKELKLKKGSLPTETREIYILKG